MTLTIDTATEAYINKGGIPDDGFRAIMQSAIDARNAGRLTVEQAREMLPAGVTVGSLIVFTALITMIKGG